MLLCDPHRPTTAIMDVPNDEAERKRVRHGKVFEKIGKNKDLGVKY